MRSLLLYLTCLTITSACGTSASRSIDAAPGRPDASVSTADARKPPDARPPVDAAPPDACGPCSFGEGSACVGNRCGCYAPTDCPSGYACDLSTNMCTMACSPSQPCNDGCCDSTGMCQFGETTDACGRDGQACVSCTGSPDGPYCDSFYPGVHCGCSTTTDCGADLHCDLDTTHVCETSCDPTSIYQQCNGGCCDPSTSKCVAGGTPGACGDNGGVCDDCAFSDRGPICGTDKQCGCNDPSQCTTPASCSSNGESTLCCRPKDAPCGTSTDCCSLGCGGIDGNLTCF